MELIEELKKTFLEEYSSAILLKGLGKEKSAIILLSKSLFALCDYILLKKYEKIPKNHSERFRMLELKEKPLFLEVDAVWSKYTDTYSKPSDEESFKLLKEIIRRTIKNEEHCKEIKDILEE